MVLQTAMKEQHLTLRDFVNELLRLDEHLATETNELMRASWRNKKLWVQDTINRKFKGDKDVGTIPKQKD